MLATCGWWALVVIGRWFDLGEALLIAWFLFIPLGPVLSAVIVTAPRFRGTQMKAPALAAAIIPPPLIILVGIVDTSSESGAVLPLVFSLVTVLAGVVAGWGLTEMVVLSQDPELDGEPLG